MAEQAGGTRKRILEAAGDIFGLKGFRSATIRQIAEAAGANVAAVSYYFRDKQGLYSAVLEDLLTFGFNRFPSEMGSTPDDSPEVRLRAFVRALCCRLLSAEGWGGYHGRARLMVKELTDPSPALEAAFERHIQPHKEVLVGIVMELLGPAAERRHALECALSIVSQCFHYVYAQPVIARIEPEHDPVEEHIEALAEHVYRFSLGGIAMIRQTITAPATERTGGEGQDR
ncbi:MAG: CerR family C-terminal domain-containing protein [Deltaproteobacteria bacterium]|nr:CerR family C-terminal domain-containing protein [Deltaproteobacteria bacterium]